MQRRAKGRQREEGGREREGGQRDKEREREGQRGGKQVGFHATCM